MERISLLLLSGGSLVGRNVVEALSTRRRDVQLLATNSIADEPSLQDFDEVRLVPETFQDKSRFEAILTEWLESEPPTLVIPCRDDDILFLSNFAKRRSDFARLFLTGAPEIAKAMLDKWQSWQLSCEHGLPFVPTMLPTTQNVVDTFVRNWDFPLLVKPRSGFASKGVSLILNHAQLHKVIGAKDVVVQKYLGDPKELDTYLQNLREFGIPLFHSFEAVKQSIQAMIGPHGKVEGVFTTLHRMRNGISVAVEEDFDEDVKALGERCAKVFAQLGWRGPLNIQCQRTPEGQLNIYEFNGRFTGATAARALLGFDEVGMALRLFVGTDIGTLTTEHTTGVLKQLNSRAVPRLLRQDIKNKGIWRRQEFKGDKS